VTGTAPNSHAGSDNFRRATSQGRSLLMGLEPAIIRLPANKGVKKNDVPTWLRSRS